MSMNFKTSCWNLNNKGLGAKLCWIFYYFNIERNYDVLKSKSSCILLNKNINFNKIETESKKENPIHSLKETNVRFVSYKDRKFKVKLWQVWSCETKNRAFFVPFILSEKNFLNICVLSQSIVHWIHFQNIHTFTYQKTLLYTFLLLVFKVLEIFQCAFKILLK